ncbi:phosphate-starvation-inducible PsiE family protein [Luteibacter sp. 3190]|uniref:phosphate-starvation-inducible PsiE family protein n=1 Tax=Luteibacter sp. 3190 TaxID=2817736 RepID=UPI00285CD2E3|nr:phosphate-starvation-inducible PsiE family protein [Luteibacter sp. 3190]MDR6937336.1 uncharacterized membrane protein (DUF373 family) [Luteibacter sp. 3190]
MRSSRLKQLTVSWSLLGYYQRFEALVALALTFLISVIIVVALIRLAMGVVDGLVFSAMDPLDHAVFQTVFGEIMTLLIALEFNHTLQYMVARQQSIVQTSVLLLIAILALARKFILLDLKAVSAAQVLALAGATLALGLTYWFIRARRDADGA